MEKVVNWCYSFFVFVLFENAVFWSWKFQHNRESGGYEKRDNDLLCCFETENCIVTIVVANNLLFFFVFSWSEPWSRFSISRFPSISKTFFGCWMKKVLWWFVFSTIPTLGLLGVVDLPSGIWYSWRTIWLLSIESLYLVGWKCPRYVFWKNNKWHYFFIFIFWNYYFLN